MITQAKFGDHSITLNILPTINREDLHGKSTLKAVNKGEPLKRAFLRPNGEIVQSTDRKLGDCDPEGSIVEKVTTAAIIGAPTEMKASSADRGMNLTAGVPTDLAGYAIDRFFPVELVGLAPGIYHTDFNNKPTTTPEAAVLVVKEGGEAFLLVGERRPTIWVGNTPNYEFFGAEASEDESSETDELSVNF